MIDGIRNTSMLSILIFAAVSEKIEVEVAGESCGAKAASLAPG
jgi:hypothetical protein